MFGDLKLGADISFRTMMQGADAHEWSTLAVNVFFIHRDVGDEVSIGVEPDGYNVKHFRIQGRLHWYLAQHMREVVEARGEQLP